MKHTNLNQGVLSNLLDRFKNVKTHKAITLFDIPLDFDKLAENRCPICGNKLVELRSRPTFICKGKRHPDKKSYLIHRYKLEEIQENIAKRKERFGKK